MKDSWDFPDIDRDYFVVQMRTQSFRTFQGYIFRLFKIILYGCFFFNTLKSFVCKP